MKRLVPGLLLTALATALLTWSFGRVALVPGLAFGGLATALQYVASGILARTSGQPSEQLLKAWGLGMGLRMLGVVLFLGAVIVDRTVFPPLPTALAFLGVLIPLMFSDIRTIR